MNPTQTRLDTGLAAVASLAASDDVFAARKTHTVAVIGSPVDAEQTKQQIEPHADRAALRSPQPTRQVVVRTSAVAGRISAATLATANRVTGYHADAQVARAAMRLGAESGLDRVPIPRFSDAQTPVSLSAEAIRLPATQAPA